MVGYVGYRMRITLSDARVIIGTFLAYDKFMNLILADSEEFRKVRIWIFHDDNACNLGRSSQRKPDKQSKRSDALLDLFCCEERT